MSETDPLQLIARFGIALAIGLVVGVERGWRERDQPAGSRTAGVRTYGLSALFGAVAAALASAVANSLVLAMALASFAGVFAWFKIREATHDEDFSATGVVAALLVFVLGALTVVGDPRAAAAGGVVTAGLLASRELLHGLLARLTWAELRSALLLLAMTVIVLPLLPDRPLGPFGGVNLREIWLFTVLTAGISYAGYLAVRILGPTRGVAIGALAGALVSSTAVTIALARRAAAGEPAGILAGGAALAGFVSIARVTAIVAIVAPALLVHVAPAAIAGGLAFGAAALALLRRNHGAATGENGLGNPFELAPLLAFAALLVAVGLLGNVLTARIGSGGLLATAGLFGLVDVDVAVLTAARVAGGAGTLDTAGLAILLALAVNAAARVVYAFAAGPLAFSGRLAAATAVSIGLAAVVRGLIPAVPL